MKQSTTRILLGAALFATLAAIWFAPKPKDEGLELVDRTPKAAPVASQTATQKIYNAVRAAVSRKNKQTAEVQPILPRERDSEDAAREPRLFSSTRWGKMPAATEAAATQAGNGEAPVVTPTPAPVAPPLPFRYLGRYKDGGKTLFFLQVAEQSLSVQVGDHFVEQYKLEQFNGTTLTFRYLPLNQLQQMEIGDGQ